MPRIQGFAPLWRPDARVLVLGTMPSVRSLAQGFYYGHPRNAFWRIVADALDEARPATLDEKKALLIGHGIALWDVLDSCERAGSLDSAIRAGEPADIRALLASCPHISRVLLNGSAAYALYLRYFGDVGVPRVRMPSTSPAYTLAYEEKLRVWRAALREAIR